MFGVRISSSTKCSNWPPKAQADTPTAPDPTRSLKVATLPSGSLQGGVVNPFSYLNNSTYHALTLKVERRFSNGLSFLAAYAKSKLLDEGDNLTQVRPGGVTGTTVQDWSNLSAERSKSLYDVPQRLVVTTLYELPFFKKGNPLVRAVLGGWQANGIMTI